MGNLLWPAILEDFKILRTKACYVIAVFVCNHSIHLHEGYRDLGYKEGDFPVSEDFARRTLSLPMFAELSGRDLDAVLRAVNSF